MWFDLVENPGRLVEKEELLHAVWGETLVSGEELRDYIREIRQALSDDASAPRFVETVRGWGYRFLPATTTQPVSSSRFKVQSSRSLMPDAQGEAEACFLKAIDIARKQQAKMWELRATVSLARLWQQEGKRIEARQRLAEIYKRKGLTQWT